MTDIATSINWMQRRRGQVGYSLGARLGPECFDAASAVYFALRSAGQLPNTLMGDADALRKDLTENGWEKPADDPDDDGKIKRGDVFIWGAPGASGGESGHAGIFVSDINIIHCNRKADGISVDSYQTALDDAGKPPAEIYREKGNKDDQDNGRTMDNTGELELLGIKDGKIIAQGWHYSTGKNAETIVFMNAVTGAEIGRVDALRLEREDLKETYPDVADIEWSGFDVSFEVPNQTSVYIKGIKSNGTDEDALIFSKIITLELAFDPEVDRSAKDNEGFYFEIYRKGSFLKRGKTILNTLSWSNELMYVPETSLTLPIEYRECFQGREEVKIYINRKVFHGLVTGVSEDKTAESLTIDLSHVVHEWQYRQISTNLAAKNRTVNDIYSTLDFRYPGWNVDYLQDAASTVIDYVYSRQNRLDGLTKTCELTEDLFWRVGFSFGRTVEIGSFGDEKPYILSKRPSGQRNIRIISDPEITHQFDNVINIATVYGEKSDSGMSSMSLRDVYVDPTSMIAGFPVVILKNGINNERNYDYINFTRLAPNNEIEYAVIDEDSVKMEGDIGIEGTFAFNDLAPFNTDSEDITDEDRAKASRTAYEAAVKRLKMSRRRYIITLTTEPLPYDVNVGDKIRLMYDNDKYILESCSDYMREILTIDDWFYITAIDYSFDQNGVEVHKISLEKSLQIDRESDSQ